MMNTDVVKLGEITSITKLAGFEFTKYFNYNQTGEIIALRALNLRNGKLDLTDIHRIDKSISDKLPRSKLYKGDILFTYTGNGYGDCALVDEDDKYHLAPNICKITSNQEKVDYTFLFYTIRSKSFYGQVSGFIGGSGQPTIPMERIRKLKIFLPKMQVQQKIANILSRYDEAIENNNKRIKLLEQMAQNLYKEWFVRFRFPGYENCEFENGIPVGWKVEKVKNLVKRLPFGKTYKKQELSNIGKIIVIDQSEDEVLGYHDDVPSHKASFDEPVALFGDHSCKYVLMTEDFSLGENIIPYLGNNIDLYYLYYSVYKIIQTEEYKRHWNLFINKKILVPIEEFQLKFRNQLIPILSTIQKLKKQNMNLSQQRDLLLPRLMSGKLEVN